jgi:hypothetical protein
MSLPRGICPRCGRAVVVRRDGQLKNHNPPPEQAVVGPAGVTLWCGRGPEAPMIMPESRRSTA